jgi:hypothetical protein
MFNALLALSQEQKPLDPVVKSVDLIHADLVEQYKDDAPAVRDCATARAQLVQLQMAVEDPEEYEPPERLDLPAIMSLYFRGTKSEALSKPDDANDEDGPEHD